MTSQFCGSPTCTVGGDCDITYITILLPAMDYDRLMINEPETTFLNRFKKINELIFL